MEHTLISAKKKFPAAFLTEEIFCIGRKKLAQFEHNNWLVTYYRLSHRIGHCLTIQCPK